MLQKTPEIAVAPPPKPEVIEKQPPVVTPPPTLTPAEKEVQTPPSAPLDVAIIISRDIDRYHKLAAQIGTSISKTGGNFRSYYFYQQTQHELINMIEAAQHRQVVAIGLKAAKATDLLGDIPVVFCQIYNYQDHDLVNKRRKGVSLVPSIEKQFAAWKMILPALKRVGVIIGNGKQSYLAKAEDVAAKNRISLLSRTAHTDKELWLEYRRMVQQVDAFWLLPDNRILSKRVLRDMIDYSLKHDTPLFTIDGLLLPAGALISAAQINNDVVSAVVDRLNAFKDGNPLPDDVTPLDDARIILNTQVLKRYNIMIPDKINIPNLERWPSSQAKATITR